MTLIGRYRPALLGMALIWFLSGPLSAQSYWHDDAGRSQYRVELLKPFLKNVDESFLNGAAFLSGSFLAGTGLRVEAEVPFSRASFELTPIGEVSGFQIGSPYLGLVLHRDNRPLAWRFGIRLPFAAELEDPDDLAKLITGTASDLDRVEAFFPESSTFKAAMEWRKGRPRGLLLGVLLGSTLVADEGFGHAEWLADYGFRLGYRAAAVQATAALTGRFNISTDDVDGFSGRSQQQVTGAVLFQRGRVRPEVLLRFPLDDAVRDAVGVVVGAGLRLVY